MLAVVYFHLKGSDLVGGKTSYQSIKQYEDKAYDKVLIRMPKGRKSEIQVHAKGRGESTNAFINRAVAETMDRETGTTPQQPHSQPSGSEDGYLTAELLKVAQDAVNAHGGNLSDFIRDAITSYAKSYPSIMKLKSMETELYAAQEEARKRVGVEEPDEPEKQEDSFSNLSTGEVVEKFMQVGELRKLNLKTTEN